MIGDKDFTINMLSKSVSVVYDKRYGVLLFFPSI
jgi:hypothetical protein